MLFHYIVYNNYPLLLHLIRFDVSDEVYCLISTTILAQMYIYRHTCGLSGSMGHSSVAEVYTYILVLGTSCVHM